MQLPAARRRILVPVGSFGYVDFRLARGTFRAFGIGDAHPRGVHVAALPATQEFHGLVFAFVKGHERSPFGPEMDRPRMHQVDFVQREQAVEKSLRRFLEKRPRPMGVVHNVTLKRLRAFL